MSMDMARISPGALFVIIIVLLLFLNPGSTPGSNYVGHPQSSVIAEERASLQVLNSSIFGQVGTNPNNVPRLNLTGMKEDDGFNWHLTSSVKEIAVRQQVEAAGPKVVEIENRTSNSSLLLYRNITGWARGTWIRSDFPEVTDIGPLNVSSVERRVAKSGRSLTHNITGTEGRMFLSLKERDVDGWLETQGDYKSIFARVTVQDATSFADGWVFRMHGVQNLRSGGIMLTTTSADFAGIFALPHFALSQQDFERSRVHIMHSLKTTIDHQAADKTDFNVNPWGEPPSESPDITLAPQCELIAYLQQHPLSPRHDGKQAEGTHGNGDIRVSESALEELEHAVSLPTGLRIPALPPLHFSATMFSPDCGYLLTTKGPPHFVPQDGRHLVGPKLEVRVEYARTAMLGFAVTLVGQLVLLVDQINAANTPSKKSRISFWSLSILSLGTGFISFAFLLLSSNVLRLLILALTIAFLAFMDGLFFTMRFLLEVWTVQEPERLERQRDQRRNEPTSVPAVITMGGGPAEVNAEPLNGTRSAATGAAAMELPLVNAATAPPSTDNTMDSSPTFGSLYTRYCLFLLSMVFISIWAASSWPRSVRSFYANALVFAYLSFWVPQIYRNITRNCRRALTKRFMIGQSALRLFPIAYLWGYEDNVLFVETDLQMLIVFIGWLWMQLVILGGQEVIGPRFFVSERWSWIPSAWEYHPILREDEEGATLPLGFTSLSREDSHDSTSLESATKSDSDGYKVFDCVICMQHIKVPVVPSGESAPGQSSAADVLSGGFMTRRHYSVTPCRHIFHSTCLESWISYRLQCPICRENLPPL